MIRLCKKGQFLNKANKNKFKAVGVHQDGYYFPSKKELNRYNYHKLREKAGEIAELRVHPRFPILINGVKVCDVELDLEWIENGEYVLEDSKGLDNPMSKLKRKLFEAYYGRKVNIV